LTRAAISAKILVCGDIAAAYTTEGHSKIAEEQIKLSVRLKTPGAALMTQTMAQCSSFRHTKSQKSLAHDDFVTVFERVPMAGNKTMAPIDESSIGGPDVLNGIVAIAQGNTRVTPGDFGFRIVGVQIHVRKNAAIRVPPADICVFFAQQKLLPGRAAALDNQHGMWWFTRITDERRRSLLLGNDGWAHLTG
jgi:hypothetical protein